MPNEFPFPVPFGYLRCNSERQTLRKETPLNNILVPCLAWVNNKDVKIIIKKKKSNQETHVSEVSFYKICLCLSAFIALEVLLTKFEFLQKQDQF